MNEENMDYRISGTPLGVVGTQLVANRNPGTILPAVHAALDSQKNAVVDLRDMVNQMSVRLETILSPAGPVPGEERLTAEGKAFTLAERMNQNTSAILESISYLRALINRLEI